MSSAHLESIDKEHIWHPFTQHAVWDAEPILVLERGEGVYLFDTEGRRYLDGNSSLWCNVHGHSEPRLCAALHQQVDTLCHATLLGATHRPVVELTQALIPLLPPGLSRVFYCDGGSVAVEAALRMAVEYWQKQGAVASSRKRTLVSLASGYHGDTLGSVGLGYVETFHQHLRDLIVPSVKIQPPHMLRFYQGHSAADAIAMSLEQLETLFRKQSDEIAAFVIEPLVQGAAGIWLHPAEYLCEVARLCRQFDVLLIVDEVATGFGKTGQLFASQRAAIEPDLLVMGKGLSAGYLPLAAVAAREHVFEVFHAPPEQLKTFFFGQTFSGNPLATRVASESLALFAERDLLAHVRTQAEVLATLLDQQIATLAHVDEIRQCGLMVGIELTARAGERVPYPVAEQMGHRITLAARKRGMIIRPLGNTMVLMPALAVRGAELEMMVGLTAEAIAEATQGE